MLSVAVHKDIAEYQPKIVGKMTMRTLVSITGALSVSVLAGLYIYFVLGLNVSDCTYFIYAVSLPFWCVGFVKPCGMPFEQFAPLWLKANFTNDRIFYKPSMRLAGLLSESENSKQKGTIYGKHYRKQGNLRGISSSSIESVPSSFGLIENRLSRFNNVLRNCFEVTISGISPTNLITSVFLTSILLTVFV